MDDTPRRAQGLRREEVAELAGISTEYGVMLERGNLNNASPQLLAGLGKALLLASDETTCPQALATIRFSRSTR